MSTTKTCSKCKAIKDVNAFYPKMGRCKKCQNKATTEWAKKNPEINRARALKYYYNNREQSIAKVRKWQANNKERDSLTKFKAHLKRTYNLSYEEYSRMFAEQEGKCAICHNYSDRRLDVDHNHTTNQIRQLLCSNCNTTIGLVDENIVILENIISYLKQHKTSEL